MIGRLWTWWLRQTVKFVEIPNRCPTCASKNYKVDPDIPGNVNFVCLDCGRKWWESGV